jgi:hypothetical protein
VIGCKGPDLCVIEVIERRVTPYYPSRISNEQPCGDATVRLPLNEIPYIVIWQQLTVANRAGVQTARGTAPTDHTQIGRAWMRGAVSLQTRTSIVMFREIGVATAATADPRRRVRPPTPG